MCKVQRQVLYGKHFHNTHTNEYNTLTSVIRNCYKYIFLKEIRIKSTTLAIFRRDGATITRIHTLSDRKVAYTYPIALTSSQPITLSGYFSLIYGTVRSHYIL